MMSNKIAIRTILYITILFVVITGIVFSITSLDFIKDRRVKGIYMKYTEEGIAEGDLSTRIVGNATQDVRDYSFTFAKDDIAKKRIIQLPRTDVTNAIELCSVMKNARMVRYLDPDKGIYVSYLCDRGFGTNFGIEEGEAYEVYFKGDASFTIDITG
jgi:hypothetical protein